MTNKLKSLAAFFLGIIALFICYYYISLPFLPCLSIFMVTWLFPERGSTGILRLVLVWILTVIGVSIYGLNCYYMVRDYPEYGNIAAIVFEAISTIAIFGAGCSLSIPLLSKRKVGINQQIEKKEPLQADTAINNEVSSVHVDNINNEQPITETVIPVEEKSILPYTVKLEKNFKRRKFSKLEKILIILVVILCFSTSFFVYYSLDQNQIINDQLDSIDSLQARVVRLQAGIENTKQTSMDLNEMLELYFYQEHAVIVTESGNRYHSYGCSHTQDRDFWIYNIEAAEDMGYIPCKDCR